MPNIHFKVLPKETVVLTEQEDQSFNKFEQEKILSQKYSANVTLVKSVIYNAIASSSNEIITEP